MARDTPIDDGPDIPLDGRQDDGHQDDGHQGGGLRGGDRRAVLFANYLSSFTIGLAVGGIIPFLSLLMERQGVAEVVIGANTAVASCGIIAVAPFVPAIARRFGLATSVVGGILISVSAFLLMAVFTSIEAWFVLRPIAAGGTAIHWIVSETWMNAVSTRRDRGRIMAIYVTAIAAGFAAGPAILTVTGIEGWAPFLVFGAGVALSALPLALVARHAPSLKIESLGTPVFLARNAPTIFAAIVATGLYAGGCFAFLPIYGLRSGLGQDEAVFLLTAFLAGNLVFQIPVGWLADRVNHRLLLLGCAAIATVAPLLVQPLLAMPVPLAVLLSIWGGAVFALYTVGITMLGERFHGGELAAANAAFVMTFELANVAGPPAVGEAIGWWTPHGMMAVLVVVAAAFALVTIFRGIHRARE